jgi:long-chain acyl-CoA synthetase
MIHEVASRHEQRPALRYFHHEAWHGLTWGEVGQRVKNLGLGFMSLDDGLKPQDRVAIIAANRPEWVLSDFALSSIGVVTVPIYHTLDAESVEWILQDSGCRGAVVVGELAAEKLQQLKKTALEWVVVADIKELPESGHQQQWIRFDELLKRGEAHTEKQTYFNRLEQVDRQQLFTIIYTSGTTGTPKGAMLTHENFLTNIESSVKRFRLGEGSEVYLSCLPLSHAYERHCQYVLLALGNEVVYTRGLDHLAEDLLTVAPTVLVVVPRVLEKFYNRVQEQLKSRSNFTRKLFHWAVKKGEAAWAGHKPFGIGLAKFLILNKITSRMGKRLRFVVCAGTAINPQLALFFNAVGICVLEGYGMTESSPVIAVNEVGAIRIGTVGKVYENLEAKIGGDGALMVRGPSIFKGYWNNPKETAKSLDADGWLNTGDSAEIDPQGYLKITGRIRDVIKTAGAKMIAPQRLEEKMKAQPWCDQVCILGEGRPFLVALIVLEAKFVQRFLMPQAAAEATRNRSPVVLEPLPLEKLILQEGLWENIEKEVEQINNGLAPFETIKRFALLAQPFSENSGNLTPTQKVRRHIITKQYADLMGALYGDHSQVWKGTTPLLPRKFQQSRD